LQAAHDDYQKALDADPLYVNPIFGLALLAIAEKNWQDAARLTQQVNSLNAYAFPAAGFYNAAANYNLGKYEMAEESARKFKAADNQHIHPEVYLLLVPNASDAAQLDAKAKEYEGLSVSKKQ